PVPPTPRLIANSPPLPAIANPPLPPPPPTLWAKMPFACEPVVVMVLPAVFLTGSPLVTLTTPPVPPPPPVPPTERLLPTRPPEAAIATPPLPPPPPTLCARIASESAACVERLPVLATETVAPLPPPPPLPPTENSPPLSPPLPPPPPTLCAKIASAP